MCDAPFSSLRQPLDHHCGNHEDPSDGDDINASALVIGHVGSGAFRGRPIGTATRLDAFAPISWIGEPG
jgi:hypothetical protein